MEKNGMSFQEREVGSKGTQVCHDCGRQFPVGKICACHLDTKNMHACAYLRKEPIRRMGVDA
jgi:hypothetical protein